ncbi:hypothetical protein PILCRDRAFT_825226 [Piloderma croceum F 1598]|uniref:Uncharacterized protein n=1 Tax=Piloderma croceum (strain F 1598) TaxID=765440 RepID=A0A0C3AUP1_PILCF|nr:hypothetical protein PILCRDRAFT_825226 [Piloderma croceum F 1598]
MIDDSKNPCTSDDTALPPVKLRTSHLSSQYPSTSPCARFKSCIIKCAVLQGELLDRAGYFLRANTHANSTQFN